MFCKNCGKLMDNRAQVCVGCGVPSYTGINFCHNCGEKSIVNSPICQKCGAPSAVGSRKSKIAAGLLGIFLGVWGVHNFYLGQIGRGVIKLCVSFGFVLLYIVYMIGMVFVSFNNNSYGHGYNYNFGDSSMALPAIIIMIFFIFFALAHLGIYIWSLVEGILILTGKINKDAKGIPLKD